MSAPLWTSEEITKALGAEPELGKPPRSAAVTGISIDTRTIAGGDLFVALRDVRDGHEFVTAAFDKGASAVLVGRHYVRQQGDGPLFRVDDPLAALETLGRAARARLSPEARVIAVTGSAGKTTTKEMLRACLTPLGKTHASEKSYNNHWGVPLTLARMPADTQFAVFEIGMNHAGEITPLSQMVRPHVAVITTVGAAHLGNFASVADVAKAKAEIFVGLEPGGIAVLPKDNAHFNVLFDVAKRQGTAIITFGFNPENDAYLLDRQDGSDADDPQSVVIIVGERQLVVNLAAFGLHMASNATAVALVLRCLIGPKDAQHPEREQKWTIASDALDHWQPEAGRGKRIELPVPSGSFLLIDESYNANPLSMNAALFAAFDAREMLSTDAKGLGRVIFVLGDMLELGLDAKELHENLAHEINRWSNVIVLACGPLMEHMHNKVLEAKRGRWAASSSELTEYLCDLVKPGDVVVIKGSNGSKMGVLVQALLARYGTKDHA
jgi:UDP-N-acetylmuramoyl-tripeptide--D-alanyl-D-alanine ligase